MTEKLQLDLFEDFKGYPVEAVKPAPVLEPIKFPAPNFLEGQDKSFKFNPDLICGDHEEFYKIWLDLNIKGYSTDKKERALNCLIANCIKANQKGLLIGISRRAADYKEEYKKYDWLGYRTFCNEIIPAMIAKDYLLELSVGKWETKTRTTYYPTRKLISLFKDISISDSQIKNPIKVQYKNRKKQKIEIKKFTHTEQMKESISVVNAYNEMIKKHDVRYVPAMINDDLIYNDALGWLHKSDNPNFEPLSFLSILNNNKTRYNTVTTQTPYLHRETFQNANQWYAEYLPQLQRVFIHPKKGYKSSLRKHYKVGDLGGRFYLGHNLWKEERKTILIDGEETVEPDFDCLHIHLIYHMILKVEESYKGKDKYTINGITWDMRPISKVILLSMLNANSIDDAINSVKNELKKDEKRPVANRKMIKVKKALEQTNTTIEQVASRLLEGYGNISDYICKDMGVRLMYFDSEIMMQILKRCMENNIPAIPVHDSLRVKKQHQEQAIAIMREEYRKYTGFDIPVTVD